MALSASGAVIALHGNAKVPFCAYDDVLIVFSYHEIPGVEAGAERARSDSPSSRRRHVAKVPFQARDSRKRETVETFTPPCLQCSTCDEDIAASFRGKLDLRHLLLAITWRRLLAT